MTFVFFSPEVPLLDLQRYSSK